MGIYCDEVPKMKRIEARDCYAIRDDHLYPRSVARQILCGVTDPTLRELEKSGALKAIKLVINSPTAQTFYRGSNLRRLVEGQKKPKRGRPAKAAR